MQMISDDFSKRGVFRLTARQVLMNLFRPFAFFKLFEQVRMFYRWHVCGKTTNTDVHTWLNILKFKC